MPIETRTYVITAESSVLDEIEKALTIGEHKATIGVKKHNPPREEILDVRMEPMKILETPPPATCSQASTEYLSLDEIEEKYGKEMRQRAEKIMAEKWAAEELEKNKPLVEKEQERMFKEMLIFGEAAFKASDLPDNLDGTIPHI